MKAAESAQVVNTVDELVELERRLEESVQKATASPPAIHPRPHPCWKDFARRVNVSGRHLRRNANGSDHKRPTPRCYRSPAR